MNKGIQIIKKFTSLQSYLARYTLSYGLLLGFFPGVFILVMGIQFSLFDQSGLIMILYSYFPSEIITPFLNYLMNRPLPGFLSGLFSLCVAIGVASQSIYCFLLVSKTQSDEEIHFFYLRIKAVLLFLFYTLYGTIGGFLLFQFSSISFPLGFLFLFIALVTFYRALSLKKLRGNYGLISSFVVALILSLFGLCFFRVLSVFSSNSIYGPLSCVVYLFLSVYGISSCIYFGICMNQVLYQEGSQWKHPQWIFVFNRFMEEVKGKIHLSFLSRKGKRN